MITDILAGQPLVDIKTFIQSVDFFLVDDASEMDFKRVQQTSRNLDARNYWSLWGMASVLTSRNLETQVKVKLDEMLAAPGIEVAILNDILTLEGCTDSFQSLNNIITYVANDGDRLFAGNGAEQDVKSLSKKPQKRTHTTLLKTKEDMLASLDEEAFKHQQPHQKPLSAEAEAAAATPPSSSSSSHHTPMLTDLKMVEGYYSGAAGISSSTLPHSILRPRKPRRKHYQQQKAPEDIVRILVNEVQEFDIVENYYGIDKAKVTRKPKVDVRRSTLSLRVRDVDLIWKLYSGYDWAYVRSSTDSLSYANAPSASTPPSSSATNTQTTSAAAAMSSSSSSSSIRRSSNRPSSSSSNQRYSMAHSNTTDSFPRTSTNSSFLPSADRLQVVGQSSPPNAGHSYGADTGTSSSFDDYRHSPTSSLESRKSAATSASNSTTHRRRQQQEQQYHHHRRINGSADMELRIEGICFELDKMLPDEQTCLHSHLEIRDIEIVDNIKTSTWDTFFGCLRPDSPSSLPRETGSCMLVVDLIGTRPVIQDTTVEYRLRIKTLPMRLYVDQDALNFLTKFFTFNSSILRSARGAKSSSSTGSPTTSPSSLATNRDTTKDDDLFFRKYLKKG